MAMLTLLIPSLALAASFRHRHQPPPPPPPPPPPVTTPTTGMQIGAFNLTVGTIQAYFDGWTDNASCAPAGQTTFIYWENYGYSLDSITNGSQDSNIRRFAAQLCPNTILSLFHEADGNWDPWDGTYGSNTPAKVVAAYQHVHDLVGSKARYAWVMNDSDVPDVSGNRPSNFWPGAAYVDIIGVDGFNWGGLSFLQAMAPNLDILRAMGTTYGKPVWVTSFGTPAGSGQAAWVTDAIAQAKAKGISALIYFNYNDGGTWTLNSAGLAAFKAAIQ